MATRTVIADKTQYEYSTKAIYTLADICDAELLIGQTGYFGDSFAELERKIAYNRSQTLDSVMSRDASSLRPYMSKEPSTCTTMFLPASHIYKKPAPEKKQYRPFKTLKEFLKVVYIFPMFQSIYPWVTSDWIKIRDKNYPGIEPKLIEGFTESEDGELEFVYLGFGDNVKLSPKELLDNWEWMDANGHMRPFGVEIEEGSHD